MSWITASYEGMEIDESREYGDDSQTLRFSNGAAENGYEQEPGGLTWLNSAQVVVDPDHDEVRLSVSVGDPRGAFVFTVRRVADGRLIIHTPHPGEGMPHCETEQLHPGTLQVKGDFSDSEPEDEESE